MATKSIMDTLVQFASVEITQGAADALITGQVSTGISTAATYGWMIDKIEFDIATLTAIPLATDQDIRIQVARGAQTAFLDFDDDDVICQWQTFIPTIAGSVGNPVFQMPYVWIPPTNYVVANPIITVLMDSTSTGIALVGRCRFFYFPVKMSELDLLRILAE